MEEYPPDHIDVRMVVQEVPCDSPFVYFDLGSEYLKEPVPELPNPFSIDMLHPQYKWKPLDKRFGLIVS